MGGSAAEHVLGKRVIGDYRRLQDKDHSDLEPESIPPINTPFLGGSGSFNLAAPSSREPMIQALLATAHHGTQCRSRFARCVRPAAEAIWCRSGPLPTCRAARSLRAPPASSAGSARSRSVVFVVFSLVSCSCCSLAALLGLQPQPQPRAPSSQPPLPFSPSPFLKISPRSPSNNRRDNAPPIFDC